MSKRSERRARRAAGSPAGTQRSIEARPAPGGARTRSPWLLGGIVVAVVLVAAGAAAIAIGGGARSSPGPSVRIAGASASAAASTGGGGSLVPGSPSPPTGGPIAEAVVAALRADPFVGHFEESIISSSITGGRRLTLTATTVGDVSGRDASIVSSSTGNGLPTEQRYVSVGDVAWFRSKGDAGWTVATRASVAGSIDPRLAAVRAVEDAGLLADLGVETLDGQTVHHFTALSGVPFELPDGVQGNYATFDVWATATGVPVRVKATFVQTNGSNSSLSGNVDIRYSRIGGPITIVPPAGAPTLAP